MLYHIINQLRSAKCLYLPPHTIFAPAAAVHHIVWPSDLLLQSCSIWIHARPKSGGPGRPKKKIYHRVHELDRVMDLRKKPTLILQLKSIIQSQRNQSLLLRDLEKQVGFVQKWNFMAILEKYPSIFRVSGGVDGSPPSISLTQKAEKVAGEEAQAREAMESIVVKNLRKLLMLSVDCRIPLVKIELIESQLALPRDFKNMLIPKYPEFFSVKNINGVDCLQLEHWDSGLAITSREEWLSREGVLMQKSGSKKVRISNDGNYLGPFAFRMKYPAGFRPNVSFLKEVERWQKMDFPSPYCNARRVETSDTKARKRVVGVLHELLSLAIEKRLTCAQMDAFGKELFLPSRLVLCLIKYQGIFYITNKGERGSVFLKEAYDESSNLVDKCPLLVFNDKFVELCGRTNTSLCSQAAYPRSPSRS
ncbi:hypothetical protein SAY86_009357 [Trapa natans]|uniref:PORR domain-containing protein n=1 Tax=Trapa natans TaxID=22666 RepID=A0AAN7QQ72_TRANT|nr:hypothetical protein SAY86_009357 [Trapa natans]